MLALFLVLGKAKEKTYKENYSTPLSWGALKQSYNKNNSNKLIKGICFVSSKQIKKSASGVYIYKKIGDKKPFVYIKTKLNLNSINNNKSRIC